METRNSEPEHRPETGSGDDKAGKLPGPASASLSSYYGMPEAGRGSGATGDEALDRAEDSDLAAIRPPADARHAPGSPSPRNPSETDETDSSEPDTSEPDMNPFADGSEDPLAVPVDLERDFAAKRDG